VSGTAPPLWSAAQQSWLQAMGYTVFVDGQLAEEPAVPAAIELSVAPAQSAAAPAPPPPPPREPSAAAPPPARRTAPRPAEAPADAVADTPARTRGAGGRRPAVRMPDRLQIALLRASGCNPAEPATQALMAGWNLDEIRGSAAAKRALWPQLRALRRQGRA